MGDKGEGGVGNILIAIVVVYSEITAAVDTTILQHHT